MARFSRFHLVTPATIAALGLLLGLKLLSLGQALAPVRSGIGPVFADAQAAPAPVAPLPKPDGVSVPSVTPPLPEPAISMAERQLLQDLRRRREALDAREHVLQQREIVLDAAEHRLTGRIAEMASLQTRLEQLEASRRTHDDANWAGLVKVYETMKPRDAAVIFNDMDMPVLLEVIDRMKESRAAQVLGVMQPDRARLVTAQLAALRTRSTTVPPNPAS